MTETKKEPTSETKEEAEKTESTEPTTENEQQTQLNGKMAEMYSVMAQSNDVVAQGTVSMGYSTILEDGGIYVPAEGDIQGEPPAQYRVVDKVSVTPSSGNYVEYSNETITVHGNVTFTSAGSSPICVKSGTLTITGDEGSSLTLNGSGGSPVQIGSSGTSANFVLAGGVDFTAAHENGVPVITSYSGNNFETAENYSGDISLSSQLMAVSGGNVNLKTSGSISLSTTDSTTSTSSIVSAEKLSLEGSSVVIDAPKASPMISVGGNVSITTTDGNLAISSDSASAPTIYSTGGTVALSAPKGDITISNNVTGNGSFSQAIFAQNVVVNDTENFIVDGSYNYAIEASVGGFTATNCHSVNIENKAEKGNGAVSGDVNITGDGLEEGQAVFRSKGTTPCINGVVKIKNFDIVNIFFENYFAIASKDGVDIEDCGLVQIGNINSKSNAVNAINDIQFKNCETVEVSSENGRALNSIYRNISFTNCGNVAVET